MLQRRNYENKIIREKREYIHIIIIDDCVYFMLYTISHLIGVDIRLREYV